jgi:2-polyprenyl-3-methyl-5-hydroxy-6-metoxy-1,4-benzoquinol methylase
MAWRRVEVVARFFRNIHSNQGDKRGPTVMDFGCGTGVLFDEVSHFAEKVYGVDIVLDPARLLVDEWELGKVTLLSPEDAKQRIPENSVDTIIAAEVLEHIAPLDDTLAFFRSPQPAGPGRQPPCQPADRGIALPHGSSSGWIPRRLSSA